MKMRDFLEFLGNYLTLIAVTSLKKAGVAFTPAIW